MNVYPTLSRALVSLALLVPIASIAQNPVPPSTISFVVGDPNSLIPGEQAIVNKLISMGHTVIAHQDGAITIDATAGSDAVLISAAVSPNQVRITFRNDPRPVMLLEIELYDEMGMTGVQLNVDFGLAFVQTQLELVDNDTSIGEGLPLGPTVTTVSNDIYSWGVPAPTSHVVATLLGDNSRAAIFAYDQGDVLTDNSPALGKRVGFYFDRVTPTVWAAAGELLFEQAIEWMLTTTPAAPSILVPPMSQSVVEGATVTFSVTAGGVPAPGYQWQRNGGDLPGETASTLTLIATPADVGYYTVVVTNSEGTITSPAAALRIVEPHTFSYVVRDPNVLISGEQAIVDKLVSMGHTVVVHEDGGISLGATAGSDAVLISGAVSPNQVGATFRNDPRPVMLWRYDLFDNMAMTGAQLDVDFGLAFAQTQLELVDNDTSIGEGLPAGPTLITVTNDIYSWGVPAPTSHVVATLLGDSSRAAIFAYDQGDVLIDNSLALGKRVGFYFERATPTVWAPAGELLFEQAIEWMFGDEPPEPTAPTILTQPTSDVVVEGSAAFFAVVADGDPSPTYRWQYNGFDLPGETGSTLTFTATLADAGDYRVVVSNLQGSVTSAAATLAVLNANDPPSFTSVAVTTATEGVAYSYGVTAADPDTPLGDALSFAGIDVPAWLALVDNGDGTAVLAGTPGAQDVGANSVALQVTDSGGLAAAQAFTVTVIDTNADPEFTSAPVTNVDEGSLYNYSISVSNPDNGETLTISAGTLPAWLAFSDSGNGSASLRGTPRQADVGDHAVELEVVDEGGATDTQAFTVTVANVEFSPTFTSRPLTAITEGQAYRYPVVASDADGDLVDLSAGTLPAWITFTDNGDGTGELLGFPVGVNVGTHGVQLFAENTSGGTAASQTFSIVVNPATDGPVIIINGLSQIMLRRGEFFRDPGATASDPQDGDLTSEIIVSNPVDSKILGPYTVTYSVRDSAGNWSQAQRSVIVQEQLNLGGGGALGAGELLVLLLLGYGMHLRRNPGAAKSSAGPDSHRPTVLSAD
jgi:hypothetical protein